MTGDAISIPRRLNSRLALEREARADLELTGKSPAVDAACCTERSRCGAHGRCVVLRAVEQVEGVETQLNLYVLPGVDFLFYGRIPIA